MIPPSGTGASEDLRKSRVKDILSKIHTTHADQLDDEGKKNLKITIDTMTANAMKILDIIEAEYEKQKDVIVSYLFCQHEQ